MASVPTEIIFMIVRLLNPSDIGSFRLCCKAFAEIGLPYLLPEVVAYLHHLNLDKLSVISQHAALSKTIRSLHLEVNGLEEPVVPFEQYVAERKRLEEPTVKHPHLNSLDSLPTAKLTQSNLEESYALYKQELAFQRVMLKDGLHHLTWKNAIVNFHNLKSITMAAGYPFGPMYKGYSHSRNPYKLECVNEAKTMPDPLGLHDWPFLLRTASQAGTKLKWLRAGSISWKLFIDLGDSGLSTLLSHFSQLTYLHLCFTTAYWEGDILTIEALKCSQLMREGALRRVSRALPRLRSLMISSDYYDHYLNSGAYLEDILDPEGYWPQLRDLTLCTIKMKYANFVAFAERHKSTLKNLTLVDILLDNSWLPFLHKIQKVLTLKTGDISGCLYEIFDSYETDFGEEWHMHVSPDKEPLRARLSEFLVNGGECPLTHDNMEHLTTWTRSQDNWSIYQHLLHTIQK